MKHLLVTNWDWVLLRGILAVLFGVTTLIMPPITLIVLFVLFGAYATVGGIATAIMAIKDRKKQPDWWLWLLSGLVSVAAGILTFVWPGITAISLFYLIVAWALVSGVLEIVLAFELNKVIDGEWTLVVCGILSMAFGVISIAQPVAGALSILWLIGIYAIAYGVALVVLAFRLRNIEVEVEKQFSASVRHTA